MKKTLSLLLAVLLMLGCMTFTATAGQTAPETDFEFSDGVITKYNGPGGDVVIPATIGGVAVTSIGVNAFGGGFDPNTGLMISNTSLTSVTIPEGVVSIGASAFKRCSSLSSVTIPNSVTSLGSGAFEYCSSLSSVKLSDSLTSIEGSTFSFCSSLTSVTIPASVKYFGYCAFQMNPITDITVNWTSLEGISFHSLGVFMNMSLSNATLHVPEGTELMYEASAFGQQFGTITDEPVPEPAPEGVSVALSPSAEEINAGETVTITVTATGDQNCADITLTYKEDVFDYTAPTTPDSEIIAPAAPDGTLRILSYNTAETIKTLTFTAKDNLTEDKTAVFGFNSAKFAATESAMTTDAVEAPTQIGTSVKVISNKHTVTFNVNGETKTQDYVGKEQTILAEHIPTNPTKNGYTFVGWSHDTNTYTTDQLTGMAVTADVEYTAVFALDVTVTVQKDYVHGTETEATSYTKIIVTGKLDGYTYGGKAMYLTAKNTETGVNTFAYIVPTTIELKAENAADYAKGLVAASATAADDISVTDKNDVNDTDKVDIADARAVYNCANLLVDLDNYMAVYIRADVNNSGDVDENDTALVINAIKTAGTVDANA